MPYKIMKTIGVLGLSGILSLFIALPSGFLGWSIRGLIAQWSSEPYAISPEWYDIPLGAAILAIGVFIVFCMVLATDR